MKIMKNITLCLTFMLLAGAFSLQAQTQENPAALATAKLSQRYGLSASQNAQMLKIQERKYRNLSEIEPLKISAPVLYGQKIRALQQGNDKSIERMLSQEQMKIHHQQRTAFREKKAQALKEMKSAGASQAAIDARMLQLDIESLQ